MLKKMVASVATSLCMSSELGAVAPKNCGIDSCAAGDKATTFGSQADPFMICPTQGLSDYMAFEYGMLALAAMTGKMPNVSDKTGDIDYRDGPEGPNESRLMQDYFRQKSGAATFDEAAKMCAAGRSGRAVIILNWPGRDSASLSAWVRDERASVSYWLPKGSLNKR